MSCCGARTARRGYEFEVRFPDGSTKRRKTKGEARIVAARTPGATVHEVPIKK